MRTVKFFASAVILGSIVIGCEKSESKPAVPTTPPAPAVPATPQAATTAPAAPGAAIIPPAATQAAGDATAQAQALLDQATQYIKENKLDLADKTLTQVEGMKSSLSPTMQKRVDDARTMLNAAKAGSGIKLPSLGGGTK